MKKRAMKKWIPKDTPYCYGSLKPCKWRVKRKLTDEYGARKECFCMYTGRFDEGLLWDACKECGEHDTFKNEEINRLRYAKWLYRNRKNPNLKLCQTTIQEG